MKHCNMPDPLQLTNCLIVNVKFKPTGEHFLDVLFTHVVRYAWGRGCVVVSVLDFRSGVSGSRLSPCHCVVSLVKKLYHILPLSSQVYKMGTIDILLRLNLRWSSIPSRGAVAILSVDSCYRKRDKLRPCGRPLACVQLYVHHYVVHGHRF